MYPSRFSLVKVDKNAFKNPLHKLHEFIRAVTWKPELCLRLHHNPDRIGTPCTDTTVKARDRRNKTNRLRNTYKNLTEKEQYYLYLCTGTQAKMPLD